ncbi:MAG: YfhO family protein [Flavobacteriales bacterium]|nr:YfhO family protein [Flavobacteriales bacterium]
MILLVAEFTAPIMAILFLDKLIKNREEIKANPKKLYLGLRLIILLVASIAISPDSFVDLSSQKELAKIQGAGANASAAFQVQDQIEQYRADIVSESAWGSFKYLFAASVLLFLFLFGKIKKEILIAGIGTLIMIDLWIVDKTYLNNEEGKGRSTSGTKYTNWLKPIKQLIPYEPSAVDQAILQREISEKPELAGLIQKRIDNYKKENKSRLDNRRVFDLQFSELMDQTHYRVLNTSDRLDQDVRVPFFHKSLGGYHGAKMKKYQELVDFYLAIEHYQVRQAFAQAGQEYVQGMLPSLKITNLLDAKYIIGPDNTGKSPELLIQNPYAYGNAWFVKSIQEVENADSAMISLGTNDLRSVAVIEKINMEGISNSTFQNSPEDFIRLTDYDPNKLSYEYSAKSDQFAVFSEIYYKPGWKAFVNGEEVDFNKVDYTLRGMSVAAGSGTIIFVFEPFSYQLGRTLVWISSILLLLFLGYMLYSRFKKE